MKATEQYFPVVLFIMLYKVVLTFESVDETLKCDHLNETATERYFLIEVPQKDLSLKGLSAAVYCAFYGDRWLNVKRQRLLICLLSVFQWHLTINTRDSYYETLK